PEHPPIEFPAERVVMDASLACLTILSQFGQPRPKVRVDIALKHFGRGAHVRVGVEDIKAVFHCPPPSSRTLYNMPNGSIARGRDTMISQLGRDLTELTEAGGAYAARHRRMADLCWPPGVRIAVNFTLDFDSMLLRRLLSEPPMQLAKGEFG